MYLCYIDESGTPEVPGVSSHFVLAGVSIPIWHWHDADREVSRILQRYDLVDVELHTGWLLHNYLEQSRIQNFADLSRDARRSAVLRERASYLLKLQQSQEAKTLRQTKKRFRHTLPYVHLTKTERLAVVESVADCLSEWGFARLFAECIDKLHFDPARTQRTVGEQAFEQVVTRFDRYLASTPISQAQKNYGLVVHDNNESVALKHTELMRHFHSEGTLWRQINHIIETPLFVDSSLTRMVQAADLCAYALRRYVENQETNLFNRIFMRADRIGVGGHTVGVRHFSQMSCTCLICSSHG